MRLPKPLRSPMLWAAPTVALLWAPRIAIPNPVPG